MTSLTAACFTCYLSSAYFPLPICSFWREEQILAKISASQQQQGRSLSVSGSLCKSRGRKETGSQTSHGPSPLQQRARESPGMSDANRIV